MDSDSENEPLDSSGDSEDGSDSDVFEIESDGSDDDEIKKKRNHKPHSEKAAPNNNLNYD